MSSLETVQKKQQQNQLQQNLEGSLLEQNGRSSPAAMTNMAEKRRRAYKACINCRMRKAKCIFSDAVFKTPCLRCQREGKECSFLPSKRGGRSNIEKGRALQQGSQSQRFPHLPIDSAKRTQKQPLETCELHLSPKPHPESTISVVSENVDTETLAFGLLRNPSDALNILARASSFSGDEACIPESVATSPADITRDKKADTTNTTALEGEDDGGPSDEDAIVEDSHPGPQRPISGPRRHQEKISDFQPIKRGYINATQLRTFVSIFFSRHHHYLPLVPAYKAPLTDELLSDFVVQEPFLLTAMVIIASRYENHVVHDQCWKYMQQLISELVFAIEPTVGAIESLLLLSENIPRQPNVDIHKLTYHEERMAWNLIGLAIRLSYYLGFDQKTLINLTDTLDAKTHRERLVWTYCYMHDRQASIRLGKAFWSRGPGLCFQNPDVGASITRDSALNFPSMALSNGNREDFSSHVQAHVELTQILTNIHDSLYPSRDRTIALVFVGEYYRILDEYTRSLAAFNLAWQSKSWETFPLNETVWLTYHYARLYAYGFAFQGHLLRKTTKYREALSMAPQDRPTLANIVFPRGLGGSPDSKFIIESKKAATDLLNLCIDKLHAGGALAYLPSRYYGYISYAVVFLVKIVFTGALVPNDQRNILTLVKQTISCFVELAGTVDKAHPLVRRIGQLRALVRALWNTEGTTLTAATTPSASSLTSRVNVAPAPETLYGGGSAISGDASVLGDGNLMDLLCRDFSATGSEASDGGADLTSLLSFDIDSEIWMSYFETAFCQDATAPALVQ
ncbi:hypothetical protein V1525DRAFT_435945 [Lipomyces kononenkoae]|uniref:Uncharacterized protein n=1 Tax=Lipomyces kononenkoae TaxID=34357 RepID=A0ACC3SR66_LIPKO